MNKSLLFSIIVPTYNRAHLISKTIESILSQTYPNFELIIVDDGSTDNTEDVIKEFLSDNVFYYKKTNEERAAARNYGTRHAAGDYINWFDSDDIMSPDNLSEAVRSIEKYGSVPVLVQGYTYKDESGKTTYQSDFSDNVNLDMYKSNPVANSPVMVRKDIALANPFNEDRELSGSEDYELWLRLAAKYQFYTSENRTVDYICHDERSTEVMSDENQLIKRYTKLIFYVSSNMEVVNFLGENLGYFKMKTYLLLAVDLALNRHLRQSREYMAKCFSSSPKVIFERGFYAFLKYNIKHSLS
jgi:glycosyltransferase involved in cell wall biosynthesis